jgi:COP9 signalosome complex subunit 3
MSESSVELEKLIKKTGEWPKLFRKTVGQLDAAIGMLDYEQHAWGILQILHFKITQTEPKDVGLLADQVARLMISGLGWQLRLDTRKLGEVSRKYTELLVVSEAWTRGLFPLKRALAVVTESPNANTLTPLHADFAVLCLKAKQYDLAAKVFNTPIYEVDGKNGLTPQDYLSYHYYAGMVFIGVKQFEKALECFQMTLIIESQVLSTIQIAAYKKYVLVSLLVHGEVLEITERLSNTLHFVIKNCRRLANPYIELSRAYKKGPEVIAKVLSEFFEEIQKDGNLGLAKQIQKAVVKRNIQKLTSTYVTLALDDIAKRAKLKSSAEAEQYVLAMIDDGDIIAKINQQKGMISFIEQIEEYDTVTTATKLDAKVKEIFDLSKEVKAKDKETVLSQNYISMTMSHDDDERGGMGGLGGFGDAQDRMLQHALRESRMTS